MLQLPLSHSLTFTLITTFQSAVAFLKLKENTRFFQLSLPSRYTLAVAPASWEEDAKVLVDSGVCRCVKFEHQAEFLILITALPLGSSHVSTHFIKKS